MIKKLSIQRNNLLTGVPLAVELPATTNELRSFLVVHTEKNYVSEFVNANIDPIFWLKKYEIPKFYIEGNYDVTEDELINLIYVYDIKGYSELENVLLKYLDDLTQLVAFWKVGNPL